MKSQFRVWTFYFKPCLYKPRRATGGYKIENKQENRRKEEKKLKTTQKQTKIFEEHNSKLSSNNNSITHMYSMVWKVDLSEVDFFLIYSK